MRQFIDLTFEVLGVAIMGLGLGYAILFVVGETIEHFTH